MDMQYIQYLSKNPAEKFMKLHKHIPVDRKQKYVGATVPFLFTTKSFNNEYLLSLMHKWVLIKLHQFMNK